ncbi:hypothetical protein [Jeotgalicoccus sp. WY2]|uniref:hypothetical protein n=1 Tax=Jeotgalicoccus sp. WY2 TaxID=2708346 RepID=UPI001BD6DA64|nr:hypothetical protein [Jeotgalicoccus sp. WY2]
MASPASEKFNYIAVSEGNYAKFRPIGTYVLVKRISAKEEQRRIIATVLNEKLEPNLMDTNI